MTTRGLARAIDMDESKIEEIKELWDYNPHIDDKVQLVNLGVEAIAREPIPNWRKEDDEE